MKFDLILHDGKIMNGVDEFPQNFDIGIKNDKIISVGDLKNESSTKKINCKKQQPKGKIVALSSVIKPSDTILNKLKEFINIFYSSAACIKLANISRFCFSLASILSIVALSILMALRTSLLSNPRIGARDLGKIS